MSPETYDKPPKPTPKFNKYFPMFMGLLMVSLLLMGFLAWKFDSGGFWQKVVESVILVTVMFSGYFMAKMDGDKDDKA